MLANATVNSSWTKVKIQKEEPRTYWVDSITRPLDKMSAQYSFLATGTGHWSGYETRKEGRKDEVKSSMYRRELKSAPYRNWNRFTLPINDADIYPRCKEAKLGNTLVSMMHQHKKWPATIKLLDTRVECEVSIYIRLRSEGVMDRGQNMMTYGE